ncbi:MAG: hypothetical protein ACJAVK_002915 [Akkermansiaceae bacterium]|jgi:hypothetical protein
MRTSLFSLGATLLTILSFYSIATIDTGAEPANGGGPINLGYFFVISACFLGAALAKEPQEKDTRFRFEIYRQLSKEAQSIGDLRKSLDKTMGNETFSPLAEDYEKTLVEMLEQGFLRCRDGLLEIPK